MTKLMSLLLVVLAIFLGYRLYVYWEKVDSDQDVREQQAAAGRIVRGDQLPGLPWQLEQSLQTAQQQGADALGRWLNANAGQVEDPRLAWIQLDYCEILARQRPNDARQLYATVRDRVATNSPVYPRVLRLERTFR